jgi:hypothetical protein
MMKIYWHLRHYYRNDEACRGCDDLIAGKHELSVKRPKKPN